MDHSPLLNTLRELILSGALPAGARVTEAALAERLGLSRTPIRLASPALALEGFLVPVGRRGYAVKDFSETESIQALDIRAMLEGYAAHTVASRGASKELIEILERCLSDGDELFAKGSFDREDEQRYGVINAAFHMAIVDAAQVEILSALVARLNLFPFVSPEIIVFDQDGPRDARATLLRAHYQHHDIVDAIRQMDGPRVEALFREHAHRQRTSMFERRVNLSARAID